MRPFLVSQRRLTWSVVTVTREDANVIAAFAAHHLSLGAARVVIYFDGPAPHLANLVANLPGLVLRPMDEAFWQEFGTGRRPRAIENIQRFAATLVLAEQAEDWMAHLDIDEFLAPACPVSDVLEAVPERIDFLELPVFERVFLSQSARPGLFDGAFRVPLDKKNRAMRAVYGAAVDFTDKGFTGHSVGKSMVRTDRAHMVMGIHRPRVRPGSNTPLVNLPAPTLPLGHFDGLTRAHWQDKLLRYARKASYTRPQNVGQARATLLREVLRKENDLRGLAALHDLLKTLSEEDEVRMRALGLLLDLPIAPHTALERFGLGHLDLSAAGYDIRRGLG